MFDLIANIWIEVIYRPILNLVVITYNHTPGPSFGLALIALALMIRFAFLYFTLQSYRHEEQLASVAPEIEKIENDKALSNKQKLQKISEITKPFGINPLFTAIPLFAQLLFLGVLYQIIQVGIYGDVFDQLYDFVKNPGKVNTMFLGFDLAKRSFLLSGIAGVILFFERLWEYNQKKVIGKSFAQKWDPLIWPLVTFIILILLPSAKSVFVITSVLFTVVIKFIVHAGKSPSK